MIHERSGQHDLTNHAEIILRHNPSNGCVRLITLQWRHNEHNAVSNHQPYVCLLRRLFRRRSKKKSKLRATGLCAGNSPVTGEFPAQMASNAENVSIWWRHHETLITQDVWKLCVTSESSFPESICNDIALPKAWKSNQTSQCWRIWMIISMA